MSLAGGWFPNVSRLPTPGELYPRARNIAEKSRPPGTVEELGAMLGWRCVLRTERHASRSLVSKRPLLATEPFQLLADDFKHGFHLEVGEFNTPLHRIPERAQQRSKARRRPRLTSHRVSRKGPTNRKASSMALVHDTDWNSQLRLVA